MSENGGLFSFGVEINTHKKALTVEAEPRKVGLNRQGEGELKKGELEVLFPAER